MDLSSMGAKNDKFKKNLYRKRKTYAKYFAKNLKVIDSKLLDWKRLCALGNTTGLSLRDNPASYYVEGRKSRRGGSLKRVTEKVEKKKKERKDSRRRYLAAKARREKGRGVIASFGHLLSEEQKGHLSLINEVQSAGISRSGAIRKALQHHPECKRLTSGCNCNYPARKSARASGAEVPEPVVFLGKKKKKK